MYFKGICPINPFLLEAWTAEPGKFPVRLIQ